MTRSQNLRCLLPLALAAAGCTDSGGSYEPPLGPPDDGGPPVAPSDPPPTGSKWQGIEVTGECGRTKLAFVLVDEVCGGTDDPAYMDYFHAPIMRDGALIGTHLFAVDATYLWVLDTADPENIARTSLLAGFGQPLAVATHQGLLLIAAGDEGLLVVDPADPASPFRVATIDVAGPALDVSVDGDRALVALGAGGVAVVDLVSRTVEKTLGVPGFAAAVAGRNGKAYVAACDNFAIIDVMSTAVQGETWLSGHTVDGILVAPAKDVTLEGDVAFVAAGRYGAVAVDISNPAAPGVLGNCTEASDLAFYASGVRQEGGTLYVAGGEWGIKPVSVLNPTAACSSQITPALPPIPSSDDQACSTEPPWEVLPWTDTWTPPPIPPEGRDPIQTLPVPGRVFAFGDATRVGLRAIDIRDTLTVGLPKLGRYSEPRLTEGLAAQGDRVLVAGKAGGLYRVVAGQLVLDQELAEAKTARAAAFLGDGRWVLGAPDPETGGGNILIEGLATPVPVPLTIWAGGIAAKADTVYVPVREGVLLVNDSGQTTLLPSGRDAELPQAIAVADDHLLLAAPEWSDALRVTPSDATPLGENGLDEGDLYDVGLWRRALPRRLLFHTAAGAVEVASLGGQASLTLHGTSLTGPLPSGDYVAGATDGDRVYLVSTDRGRYRTMLVTVSLDGGAPVVQGVTSFTGMGTALASLGGRLYLADGDRGLRVFDSTASSPTQIDVLELGAQP